MPKITALLHTHNDGLRLGRALQSLRPCDELLVIDNDSQDDTARVAREHGAIVKAAIPGVAFGAYAMDASHDWILWIRPNESLSDDLEASLFEWKNQAPGENVACYKISIREESNAGWLVCQPEVRLLNRAKINWLGENPPDHVGGASLNGDLLRFHLP